MSTTIEMQAKAAETQGQIRNLQAQLFTVGIREEALAKERQATERELAGAIGRLNAWAEARQIAVAAEKQAAAKAQGGPVAAPETEAPAAEGQ